MSACWQIFTSSLNGAVLISHYTSQPVSQSFSYHYSCFTHPIVKVPFCSPTGFQEMYTEPLEPKTQSIQQRAQTKKKRIKNKKGVVPKGKDEEDEEDDEVGISKIQVPRQKYIPVSKSDLLDAIVSMMFQSPEEEDVHHFLLLSKCLDSILHAEHKNILEEMRSDYNLTQSVGNEESVAESSATSEREVVANGKESDSVSNSINGIESMEGGEKEEFELENSLLFKYGLDLRSLLRSPEKNLKSYTDDESRVAVATRFQRAFMQLLSNAEFEELSARDLMLTSALNTDYLLTLPIYVDWKRAYKSNAIIFRRGYTTERQKGLLLVEKLDYLQSKLLQGIFFVISKPLERIGAWITELFKNASHPQEVQDWTDWFKIWIKELSVFQKSLLDNEHASDYQFGADQLSDRDLPIWLAAQRAVARYEGILSPVGPRGRLLRKLLSWIGVIPPTPETPFEEESDSTSPEPYLRPIFLSRISLSDIWRPATRKCCGNDLWKVFKTSISIILSQSILQETAFEELILLYTNEVSESEAEDKVEVPSLQLKIYERIRIPDLPVVFPHKKLSFRIIDTVRLDVASILGLLAYIINYKFENVLFSPSAVFLDVVAISALVLYVSRVVLGYKQTWDRYQLLVNKTLYEKTLASGFGSVHFILDASEQQQYKEAILAYAILLKAEKDEVITRQNARDKCERFMYEAFKAKVEMPIEKAVNTLLRLSLVIETCIDGENRLQAIPCSKAYEALKQRWNSLLSYS